MRTIKIITGFCFFGVLALLFFVAGNHGLPLGWDPLSYRNFMILMQQYGDINIGELVNHQVQFEAFFGTVSYVLGFSISVDVFLTWGYALLTIAASVGIFLLGKRRGKYTLISYFGAALMLFSAVRYQVFGWGLGKEMIATFLFLLALRYHKNILIFTLLSATCIGLHKLTGSMMILCCGVLFFLDHRPKKEKIYLFYGVLLGAITYIPTFQKHLLPFFGWGIGDYIGVSGVSGTLLPPGDFWIFESCLLVVLGVVIMITSLKKKHVILAPLYQIMLLSTAALILIRVVGHSRIGAFFDLFLVICVAVTAVQIIPKKLLIGILTLQSLLWGYMATTYFGHEPTLNYSEIQSIEQVHSYIPGDAILASLSPKYQAWLFGYSGLGIDALYSGVFDRYFSVSERKMLKNSPDKLCEILAAGKQNFYIYVGRGESSLFPHAASCLTNVHYFDDGASLYFYSFDAK